MRNYTNEELVIAIVAEMRKLKGELKDVDFSNYHKFENLTVKTDGYGMVEEFCYYFGNDMGSIRWEYDDITNKNVGGFYRCDTNDRLCKYGLDKEFYENLFDLGEIQWETEKRDNRGYFETNEILSDAISALKMLGEYGEIEEYNIDCIEIELNDDHDYFYSVSFRYWDDEYEDYVYFKWEDGSWRELIGGNEDWIEELMFDEMKENSDLFKAILNIGRNLHELELYKPSFEHCQNIVWGIINAYDNDYDEFLDYVDCYEVVPHCNNNTPDGGYVAILSYGVYGGGISLYINTHNKRVEYTGGTYYADIPDYICEAIDKVYEEICR